MIEDYQKAISLDTLYATKNNGNGVERQNSGIEILGGTATIYGSITLPVSPPTGMTAGATDFEGLDTFGFVPNYLYVTGTATSVIVSSIEVEAV